MPNSSFGANAPYNFIPLPEKVLEAAETPRLDHFKPDLLSGYFDCTLTTLTPLYIRSTLTETEYKKREERKDKKKASDDKPDFFSPGKQIRIPGSSLRGMTRMLVEILSSSSVQAVSNQQMFFRGVGGISDFPHVDAYINRITEEIDGRRRNISRAGCIVKQGGNYSIYESRQINGRNKFRVEPELIASVLRMSYPKNIQWVCKQIWFSPPLPPKSFVEEFKLRSAGVKPAGWEAGWLIVPGKAPPPFRRDGTEGVKRHWIITEPDYSQGALRLIPMDEMLDYRDGGGVTQQIREKDFSVLPPKDGIGNAYPCFFTLWDEDETKSDAEKTHVNFGHTAYFRLPYKNRPKDLVPKAVYEPGYLDFTQALFGTAAGKGGKAGRVFFEDARLDPSTHPEPLMPTAYPKILSTPKPTSFQHYVEQPEEAKALMQQGRKKGWAGTLQFWDSENKPKIRGHKLYWHRKAVNWSENDSQAASSQHTRIKPIREGVTFHFRVRFENLSKAELGALATALFLPNGLAHKLGMGKPLGLGSVRVDGQIYRIDRQARYSGLFSDEGDKWESGVSSPENPADYQQTFANLVLGKEDSSPESVWTDKRLTELKVMLTQAEWPEGMQDRTRYMEIERSIPGQNKRENEYRDRYILLSPHEVWKGKADTLPPTGGSGYNPSGPNRPNFGNQGRDNRSGFGGQNSQGQNYSRPDSRERPRQAEPAKPQYPPPVANLLRDIQSMDSVKARKGESGRLLSSVKGITDLAHKKMLAGELLKRLEQVGLKNEPKFEAQVKQLQEIVDTPS